MTQREQTKNAVAPGLSERPARRRTTDFRRVFTKHGGKAFAFALSLAVALGAFALPATIFGMGGEAPFWAFDAETRDIDAAPNPDNAGTEDAASGDAATDEEGAQQPPGAGDQEGEQQADAGAPPEETNEPTDTDDQAGLQTETNEPAKAPIGAL
ncbi:MAG: hypothetical protein LBL63_02260 [Clostridiales Family XIII bacterium]|jgi:hypothetical protein|nr:hypothetical protein [Clostridiales Family XIII bacterium]